MKKLNTGFKFVKKILGIVYNFIVKTKELVIGAIVFTGILVLIVVFTGLGELLFFLIVIPIMAIVLYLDNRKGKL